jgi:hypothetical protein
MPRSTSRASDLPCGEMWGQPRLSKVAPRTIFDHSVNHHRSSWGPTMRGLLTLAYCLISILTAGQVIFRSSVSVGVSALVASALGFFGTATFFGSFLARREKKSSALELTGIGAIAVGLVIAAFGLMLWSGFSLSLDGVLVPGSYWVAVGMVAALLVTTKQHAL